MSDYTPTTKDVRSAASRALGGDWFDRWLVAHDAEVRASVLVEQGGCIVLCARCGKRPVVASDVLNSDIVVCGDCGVQIGLHDLAEQGEPGYEYRITDGEFIHYTRSWSRAVRALQRGLDVRKRIPGIPAVPAGPWTEVEENGERGYRAATDRTDGASDD